MAGGIATKVAITRAMSLPGLRKSQYKNQYNQAIARNNSSKMTIRTARITILILLEHYDVMHMKSLRKRIAPEFSDVMITYVVGGEARDANPINNEK